MPRLTVSTLRRLAIVPVAIAITVGATWIGLPDALAGAQLAAVALVGWLWLRARWGAWDLRGVLALAVVVHGRAVFASVWGASAPCLPLWRGLMDTALVALVAAHGHPASRELRAVAALMLTGIPAQPAGTIWASFPLVCLLVTGVPVSVGRWAWVCVAWAAFELVRAPCRFDAALALSAVALGIAGCANGKAMAKKQEWLGGIGAVLLVPVVAGLGRALYVGTAPARLEWGVNANPLAAQAVLGGLLLHLGLRRRQRLGAWAALVAGAAGALALCSFWACACLVPVAGVSILPAGRLRRWAVYALGAVPFVTPLAAFATPLLLPTALSVSYLARQYHWYAALHYVAAHPWGGGLGNVHPQALGLAVPPRELAVIPAMQMQHAHHALLQLAEQGGPILLAAAAALALRWIIRFARSDDMKPAGIGLLYLWLHNGADFSLSYEPLVLTAGLLLGLTAGPSPGGRVRAWTALVIVFAAVWLTSIRVVADQGRATRGEGPLTVTPLDGALDRMWGHVSLPGTFRVIPHGRCSAEAAALVDEAAASIERWHPREAQRLLAEAVRLDPAGVIPRGGGRARVMLALVQRETGRGRRADETVRGLRWSDGEATQALAALEYYSLRGHTAAADSLIQHVLRTSTDKALVARFSDESLRRRSGPHPAPTTPQEVFTAEIERLLANGFVEHARQRLRSAGVRLEDWARTMLWAKVAAAEGDMTKASVLAARAVASSGGSDAARWELATMLQAFGRTQEALREATGLVVRRPQDPGVWLLRAQILLDAGRADEALRDLEQAQARGADTVAVVVARSQGLRMTGQTREARRILVSAFRANPRASWPAWELASWAEAEGRFGEAMQWAKEALARNRSDHGSRVLLGRVLAAQGRTREALEQLQLVAGDSRAPPRWRAAAEHELQQIRERGG